ncbi:ribonuclease J [Candidatus Woesebacteria bacterium]|nr:ribonuclease J [Candidatus Woesebacteria bacterium]
MTNLLKFIAISGTTGVTENMYVYEYGNDIIIVDCGIGFPEEAAFGIDLQIPDFSYLVKNKNRVRAVLVTHGHEDHLGALPFLFQEFKVPIYATKLVAGFIEDKFADYGIRGIKVNVFDPEGDQFKIGQFRIDSFRVTHSIPDSVGFSIETPAGKIFHVPDYKFDWTPVSQKPFDIAKAARLAKDGVVALASDSLGATSPGYTHSELEIEKTIELIVEEAKSRVFFTTISSNISRIQQVLHVADRLGRKVVLLGRSIEKKSEIARKLGYLNYGNGLVISSKQAAKLAENQVLYVVSGSYGQVGSALYRAALGEHQFLKIKEKDVVIFSGDPAPPGTESAVNYIVDNLIENGAEVHYYDTQEDLHVSGHGSQKDIEMLFALVRPKYILPIGGTIRHMRAHRKLAEKMGWKPETVFELREGEVVEFTKDSAIKGETVPAKSVLVDGLGVGDVGQVVLKDRKTLAKEGVVIVILQLDKASGKIVGKPELISRGFVFAKEQQSFLDRAGVELVGQLQGKIRKGDGRGAKDVIVDFLGRFFFDETGRQPMVLPVVVEV